MTDEIKLLCATPQQSPRRVANEAPRGSRFGDTLGLAMDGGSPSRAAGEPAARRGTDAPPDRPDAPAAPATPKQPGNAHGSAGPRGHRQAGRGASGAAAGETPAQTSAAAAPSDGEDAAPTPRAGATSAAIDPAGAAVPQLPMPAPPQALATAQAPTTTGAPPPEAATLSAASRTAPSASRGPIDAAQASRPGAGPGAEAATLQAMASASAAASSAPTASTRATDADGASGASQAPGTAQPPNANVRVDWQPAAARVSRGGEAGGLDAAEPGRTAARLIETLRASRMAAAGEAGGADAAGPASFAAALAAAAPGASGAAGVAPTSAQDAAPPVQLTNPWPIDDPAFAQQLAAQVQESVLGGIERAEISVTPPSMGPIRIELSLSGEQASVAFSATMPDTCRAIEQSLPLLESMLSEHGLVLAEASVGSGYQGPAAEQGRAGGQTGGEPGAERRGSPGRQPHDDLPGGSINTGAAALARPTVTRGLLDLFA